MMTIHSLKKYQGQRRCERFSELPGHQRAAAEAHFQRLCARWGGDLPQWRRAILVGRAKDLAIRPRDGAWGRQLRRRGTRSSRAADVTTSDENLATHSNASHSTTNRAAIPTVSPQAPPMLSPSEQPNPASSPTFPAPIDVLGMSTTGSDGYDTVQRILRDVEDRAFSPSPFFTMGVVGKDLPPRWIWRLIVVPVS